MQKIEINEELVKKVLKIVDAGLVHGLGKQEEGKMCVEAAVCYALGLPHGDNPPCVGSAVRRFKIRLNDSAWPTDADRTKGMRKLAIAQLGSNEIDQREFANKVALKTIQRIIPLAIRHAMSVNKKINKEEMESLAKQCEGVNDLQKGRELCIEIRDKMRTAYATAATYAAAATAATYATAATAATYATAATATAAAAAAAAAADVADVADVAARLKVLNMAAEIGLEALIELKSPGCKYLDLTN